MTNIFTAKTNFTAGELSHNLLGRVDLRAYANGAMELKNVFIEPTGGIKRRPGLRYINTLNGTGKLICLEYSTTESYLVILQHKSLLIYHHDTLIISIETPYTNEHLNNIRWCQYENKLLLTHPDIQPKKLEKTSDGWALNNFTFMTENGCILEPYHKFCNEDITIKSSAVSGKVTLTTSANFFEERHIGKQIKIAEGYAQITSISSSTEAQADIKKKLVTEADDKSALEPTRSFYEPAFNDTYGWPICTAFYQSRLVFGGSRKLPNTLWFSQSADITNFELGDGYDSHAIEFTIMSDGLNAICALYSGRHLQIFTTSSEWMVSGNPLTPSNIQLNRQTQVGSRSDRYIPPLGVDGATIFAAANGYEIREFLFSDIEQAYQATDLSLLASHLIDKPIDSTYDKHNRQTYIVMQNGHIGVLCSFRSEDIQSWTELITNGTFLSICMVGTKAYTIVLRNNSYYLECFDNTLNTDCSIIQTSEIPSNTFNVPEHLIGQTTKIMADDIVLPDEIPHTNTISLPITAHSIEMGIGYTHIISPLPPAISASNTAAPVSCYRLVKAIFRLIDTNTLEIDTGSGIRQEMPYALNTYTLNSSIKKQTTDIVIRSLRWNRSPTTPPWRIIGSLPKPFKIVSVTQDLKIGG
ncbi:MAG: hypothetical protein IKV03_04175 [Alphaproteobacteria bacterium]|nr:hypothetical protein [Alphaproteobacteria bacterium]